MINKKPIKTTVTFKRTAKLSSKSLNFVDLCKRVCDKEFLSNLVFGYILTAVSIFIESKICAIQQTPFEAEAASIQAKQDALAAKLEGLTENRRQLLDLTSAIPDSAQLNELRDLLESDFSENLEHILATQGREAAAAYAHAFQTQLSAVAPDMNHLYTRMAAEIAENAGCNSSLAPQIVGTRSAGPAEPVVPTFAQPSQNLTFPLDPAPDVDSALQAARHDLESSEPLLTGLEGCETSLSQIDRGLSAVSVLSHQVLPRTSFTLPTKIGLDALLIPATVKVLQAQGYDPSEIHEVIKRIPALTTPLAQILGYGIQSATGYGSQTVDAPATPAQVHSCDEANAMSDDLTEKYANSTESANAAAGSAKHYLSETKATALRSAPELIRDHADALDVKVNQAGDDVITRYNASIHDASEGNGIDVDGCMPPQEQPLPFHITHLGIPPESLPHRRSAAGAVSVHSTSYERTGRVFYNVENFYPATQVLNAAECAVAEVATHPVSTSDIRIEKTQNASDPNVASPVSIKFNNHQVFGGNIPPQQVFLSSDSAQTTVRYDSPNGEISQSFPTKDVNQLEICPNPPVSRNNYPLHFFPRSNWTAHTSARFQVSGNASFEQIDVPDLAARLENASAAIFAKMSTIDWQSPVPEFNASAPANYTATQTRLNETIVDIPPELDPADFEMPDSILDGKTVDIDSDWKHVLITAITDLVIGLGFANLLSVLAPTLFSVVVSSMMMEKVHGILDIKDGPIETSRNTSKHLLNWFKRTWAKATSSEMYEQLIEMDVFSVTPEDHTEGLEAGERSALDIKDALVETLVTDGILGPLQTHDSKGYRHIANCILGFTQDNQVILGEQQDELDFWMMAYHVRQSFRETHPIGTLERLFTPGVIDHDEETPFQYESLATYLSNNSDYIAEMLIVKPHREGLIDNIEASGRLQRLVNLINNHAELAIEPSKAKLMGLHAVFSLDGLPDLEGLKEQVLDAGEHYLEALLSNEHETGCPIARLNNLPKIDIDGRFPSRGEALTRLVDEIKNASSVEDELIQGYLAHFNAHADEITMENDAFWIKPLWMTVLNLGLFNQARLPAEVARLEQFFSEQKLEHRAIWRIAESGESSTTIDILGSDDLNTLVVPTAFVQRKENDHQFQWVRDDLEDRFPIKGDFIYKYLFPFHLDDPLDDPTDSIPPRLETQITMQEFDAFDPNAASLKICATTHLPSDFFPMSDYEVGTVLNTRNVVDGGIVTFKHPTAGADALFFELQFHEHRKILTLTPFNPALLNVVVEDDNDNGAMPGHAPDRV